MDELYTLTRQFQRDQVVDEFISAIWTDRYAGDSGVELVVPANSETLQKVPVGTFMGIDESDEIMMIETHDIEEGICTMTGISLLEWMNNRFIRSDALHESTSWNVEGLSPDEIMVAIVQNWLIDSVYLDDPSAMGILNAEDLKIPGLSIDSSEVITTGDITMSVPFGPVYDVLKQIADTYATGITITLVPGSDPYSLEFKVYHGVDRTSDQTVEPIVRFSPDMNSLNSIKELQSIAPYKNLAWAWASSPGSLTSASPGQQISSVPGPGFDLRAMLVSVSDITIDGTTTEAQLEQILNQVATDVLYRDNKEVKLVDGEIIPHNDFRYKINYNLGDIVEMEGYSGIISKARVTEYIRSKDVSGVKAYPTLTLID